MALQVLEAASTSAAMEFDSHGGPVRPCFMTNSWLKSKAAMELPSFWDRPLDALRNLQ